MFHSVDVPPAIIANHAVASDRGVSDRPTPTEIPPEPESYSTKASDLQASALPVADNRTELPILTPDPIAPGISTPPTPAPEIPAKSIPESRSESRPETIPAADAPIVPLKNEGIVELSADRQTYDRDRQIFTAEGNVAMKFRNSLLVADRVQVNLLNRFAVGEGKVTLRRGDQVLQGDRFEYNFVQGEGKIRGVRGEIYIPNLGNEDAPVLPTDLTATRNIAQPIGEQIYANQPPQSVQSASGVNINVGARSQTSGQAGTTTGAADGQISRLRFEADTADFNPEGLVAENVRITNDPFSPPELELRSPRVVVTRISPLQDEIRATKPKLVFDQRFKLPLFRERVLLDRRKRAPALFELGFDSDERGGLFVGRPIELLNSSGWQFTVTPQFLAQRAITDGLGASSFGLRAKLQGNLGPRTFLRGKGSLSGFNFSESDDLFRGSLRVQQLIGTHNLSFEASYRDRLFNNSLGFQNVRSSVGLLFYSPSIALGKTGINASYQVGYQSITANTDRIDLLEPTRPNDRISLSRFQSSAALSRGFNLWRGKPLPATPTQGLRYTPTPLVPYVALVAGVTGIASLYSNGDSQRTIGGSLQLVGQLGHSSRDFLDYTAFNITYSTSALGGLSPFLFDRAADTQVLFAGITQQVYGPLRVGIQTAWNLDTGKEISTDYLLEYSRRTHSILLRYNPVQQLGSVSLRISDFNWTGGSSEVFGGSGVRPISGGVSGNSD
jgi:hypothetical protein